MGFLGMFLFPLIVLFAAGLVCLILGLCIKAKRKRLLITGGILCALLPAFLLLSLIGTILLSFIEGGAA